MIKKLIIIEGTDNSGKDTLIENLKSHLNNVETRHFEKPKSKTNEECAIEQNESFLSFVKSIIESDEPDKTIILNRAWYGELVYGTLYRGRTNDDVLDMIWACECLLDEYDIPTTYIQLLGDPDFLSKNDDGKSLSEGKCETIKKETDLFIEAFNKSLLQNKILIEVNKNGKFISKEEVLKKSLDAIDLC